MNNLGPIQQSVLDHIASGEASNYSEIYGGHLFRGFHDHPQIAVPLPGGKGYTTAAGRYQMTAPTWQAQKKRLGLPDFSPASQDLAAWDLAQRTYQQKTGRDLAQDQAEGRVNWQVLGNQWTSLRGQTAPNSLTLVQNMPAVRAPQIPGQTISPVELGDQPLSPTRIPRRTAAPNMQPTWSLTPVSNNPFQQEASNESE